MNAAANPIAEAVRASASGFFLIHGDGTATDTRSGLMWTVDDVTAKPVKHEAAMQACTDCRVGGHEDWRAPTVEELFLLADRTRELPAIDTEVFPSCEGGWYWSSTLDCASPSVYAWGVSFSYGASGYDYRANYYRVRAVRVASGQSSASLAVAGSGEGA
jgi:hypothetical protein